MAKEKPDGPLDEEDLRLWRRAMRDAKPLSKRKRAAAAPKGPPPERPAATPAITRTTTPSLSPSSAPATRPRTLPVLAAGKAAGVDGSTLDRLRRGRLALEGRIDLHGHTQEEAHRALIVFVEAASRRGARCLLVITGKGQGGKGGAVGGGVLKAAVPRWLNEAPLRSRILAFAGAQPKDGGGGALYVLLRRQR